MSNIVNIGDIEQCNIIKKSKSKKKSIQHTKTCSRSHFKGLYETKSKKCNPFKKKYTDGNTDRKNNKKQKSKEQTTQKNRHKLNKLQSQEFSQLQPSNDIIPKCIHSKSVLKGRTPSRDNGHWSIASSVSSCSED